MFDSLYDLFLNHTGRTIHKLDSYFHAYERHFSQFVGEPVMMIEIGAGLGGSAQMWKQWLGPHAHIVSLDIREECRGFEEDQIDVRIGHQGDTAFLQSVIDEFGTPDIVIDDGSHQMADLIASFRFLYPKLHHRGIYLTEDLHTCYIERFGGGYRNPASFIEYSKHLIDELNAAWVEGPCATPFTSMSRSIHFYDSIAVFERGSLPNPKLARRIPEPPPGTRIMWPDVPPIA